MTTAVSPPAAPTSASAVTVTRGIGTLSAQLRCPRRPRGRRSDRTDRRRLDPERVPPRRRPERPAGPVRHHELDQRGQHGLVHGWRPRARQSDLPRDRSASLVRHQRLGAQRRRPLERRQVRRQQRRVPLHGARRLRPFRPGRPDLRAAGASPLRRRRLRHRLRCRRRLRLRSLLRSRRRAAGRSAARSRRRSAPTRFTSSRARHV